MKTPTTAILLTTTTAISGFAIHPQHSNSASRTSTTALNGLFDGVKEAFSAPPSQLSSERETPIDRWMGWSVVSENIPTEVMAPGGKFATSLVLFLFKLFLASYIAHIP